MREESFFLTKLRGLLTEKGITSQKITSDLGLHAGSFSNVLCFSNKARESTARGIADYLGISFEELGPAASVPRTVKREKVFLDNLEKILRLRGLTRTSLANFLELSLNTVRAYESRGILRENENLKKMLYFLAVPLEVLTGTRKFSAEYPKIAELPCRFTPRNFAALLRRSGLTAAAVAESSGLAAGYVLKVKNSPERSIPEDYALQLARALDVPAGELRLFPGIKCTRYICYNLAEILEQKEVRKIEISSLFGVSFAFIEKLISGKFLLCPEDTAKLAYLLNTPVYKLARIATEADGLRNEEQAELTF